MTSMQFELLYDTIVVSIETDDYCSSTSLLCCNSLATVACVKLSLTLVMFPHLLCCVIIMKYFHCLSHLVSPLSL